MIDLHCHVLPGIDDGPEHERDSIMLARAAASGGCQIIAATPHLREDHPAVRPQELAERCRALNEALAAASVAVEVVPGGEVDVLWARSASEEDLRLASFGQRGTDLLLETPYGPLPFGFEQAVAGLRERGYRILLAHPERNPTFQREPARLRRLVHDGVLVQVTAQSLVDTGRRSASHELAIALVEQRLAHVIATDAHRATEFRPPNLAAGVLAASAIAPARATWMVVDAPLAILAGRPLGMMPADPARGAGIAEGAGRRPQQRWLSRLGAAG